MSENFIKLSNPYLKDLDGDKLYHIGLTAKEDLEEKFGNVKFVCVGGSKDRIKRFSEMLQRDLKSRLHRVENVIDYTKADRYSLYKVGPILCANHGIGICSLSILLCELIKLLYYAKATNVTFFRLGTSGGIGVEPGTVVVTRRPVNHNFEPIYELPILGKTVRFKSELDKDLANELVALSEDDLPTILGDTMSAYDFYEGEARIDGPFCDYTNEDKMNYLRDALNAGVRNMEMECTCLAAMCGRAGIRTAVVCIALLDRLNGDQVSKDGKYYEYESRPLRLVSKYICGKLLDQPQ